MKATVMHWPSLFEPVGAVRETTWDRIFEVFRRVRPFLGDDRHPGWSAGRFDPPERALENVRELSAMVLDYDGTETIEAARELWGGYYGLLHTSRSHTDAEARFRVILPLSRTVSPFEYAGLWRRLDDRAGGKLDPAPKDPSRFWFVPGVRDGGSFEAFDLTGQPMNPDEILALPEPQGAPPPRIDRPETQSEREQRAVRYIDRMPPAISGSGGHGACWSVARKLAQDFGFDEATTFRLLWTEYNRRCTPPWTEKELRHKAHDAVEKARVSNPVGDRFWEVPRSHYATRPQSEPDADGVMPDPEPGPKQPAAKRHGARSMLELLEAVVARAKTQIPERGVTSGNFEIDEVIGGFRRQRVTILGAETSFGKSSFAIMVADEALLNGAGVLLVSGEDGPDTYGQRIMARRSGVNALRIRDNVLTEDDVKKMNYAMSRAEIKPFFIDGIGKTAETLSMAIREVCAENQIDLVIVDYIQAFTCAKRCQDRRVEVTHMARCFVDAIKGANAAGLVLSQIRRAENATKQPTMHDLKESGDLENMAEHVLIGHLETNMQGADKVEKRWLSVGKNKDGGRNVDRIAMPFDTKTASFRTVRGERYQNRYQDSVYDQFDNVFDN